MSNFKFNSVMLVMASSLSFSALAQDQSLNKTDEHDIEKIVIKGSKQELTLQEFDASVELFTTERLDAERIVDVNDVLIRIPNVSGTGSNSSLNIRGIDRRGVGQGVSSSIYLDGSPLSGTALGRGVSSLWDTQQVEVLRGSQSSIQGRNALAGAVIITSNDPSYEADGKIRVTYADNNTYQFAGAFGNAIVDDQLAFRLAADIQKTDGYIEHSQFEKNTNFEDRTMLRAKFLFEPKAIDDLTMNLVINYNDINIGNGGTAVRTNFDITSPEFESFDVFDYKDSGDNPRNDTQTLRFILDTYYELSDNWAIKNILTHEKTEVDRLFGDVDNPEFFNTIANNFFDEKINTAELRLTFDYEHITGVVGAYYYKSNRPQTNTNTALLNPLVIAETQGFGFVTPDNSTLASSLSAETETTNKAIFAQARIDVTDKMVLDLGIRYDDERFINRGITEAQRNINPESCVASLPGFFLGVPLPVVNLSCNDLVAFFLGEETSEPPIQADYNAWLPKATLTYNIDENHSIFASAQRGYRAGGSYLRLAPGEVISPQTFDSYDPEYLDTIEIGNRSIFANGDVIFNSNVFYSKYNDQQVVLEGEIPGTSQDNIIANAAESTIYGLELSMEYFLSQQWDLYASLGLLSAKYDDFPFAEQGEFSNLKGNTLPGAAKASAALGANWRGDNGLFANFSAYYSSSRPSDRDNLVNSDIYQSAIDAGVSNQLATSFTEEVDAYFNVNMRFGYEMDNITIYAFGTNILNEKVMTSRNFANINRSSGEISLANGGTNTSILPPRAFGIGIDYSF